MSHSSPHKAQLEPLSALAAVLAITMAISLYAGVYANALPHRTETAPATATTDRVVHALSTGGVIDPTRLSRPTITATVPASMSVAVTLYTDEYRWSIGATPPDHATRTVRTVPIRVAGTISVGQLRVVIWS